ncbi:MAG: hypothetical protein ABI231_00355 [Candidatus Tumulicola sp.]
MRRFPHLVLLTLCALVPTWSVGAAAQQHEVPLSSVARSAHLSYSWLAASRVLELSGPGIVMVFRPGEDLYEINDRVESTPTAPRYAANNELYVTSSLAHHIVALARYAQARISAAENAQRRFTTQNVAAIAAYSGTILLNVEQLKGAEAVLITGQAPPTAPVLITLLGLLSSDLPNVLLSRHDLQAGPDGKFQAIVPIGPDYLRGSFLRVLATSGPGVTSASAQILITPPNDGLKVPAEQQPGGIW